MDENRRKKRISFGMRVQRKLVFFKNLPLEILKYYVNL